MVFHKVIAGKGTDQYKLIHKRTAVRGVIVERDKILLIHTNLGDYKFPGGGVEKSECHIEGLIREVREETGYVYCRVKSKIGTVIERKLDKDDREAVFQMTSYYYLCDLLRDDKVAQQLDDYETEQDFRPKWVSLDEAIEQNESLMDCLDKNDWIVRETLVLKELREKGGIV